MILESSINIVAIFTANIMAIILLFIETCGNFWRLRQGHKEDKQLTVLITVVFISCIIDPLVFLCDGQPGWFAGFVIKAGNTFLFITNVLVGALWDVFVITHLKGATSKARKIVVGIIASACLVLLIVNFFFPVVFYVSPENVYERKTLYWLYLGIDVCFMIDSLLEYIIIRIKGGILKFFPIWAYLLPTIIGMVCQTVFYGISVVWPAVAVAVAGILTGLQNDMILRDRMTGLYNRFYMDDIKRKMIGSNNTEYTVLLFDLNDFQAINDSFGHKTGDEAIVRTAEAIKEAVGTMGSTIRYAGDEFVVILNTLNDEIVNEIIGKVNDNLDEISKISIYNLSISVGISKCDLKENSIDYIMNMVDKSLATAKYIYYENHTKGSENRTESND